MNLDAFWKELAPQWKGSWFSDDLHRNLYATDASIYQETPLAVAIPKNQEDLVLITKLCFKHNIPLIPRGAGTSLAGQVVGNGIVIDTSKFLSQVLEINSNDAWVRVQPGIIRDELNQQLQDKGLVFGPETSTSNRCTIGGMIGNNSCGSRSLIYGSTRDQLLELKVLCANGEILTFKEIEEKEFFKKLEQKDFEGSLYQQVHYLLQKKDLQDSVEKYFPKKSIHRRNHGYAIDYLINSKPFNPRGENFNFCKLLAGSEGTLGIILEAKLKLSPSLSKHHAVLCAHCDSLEKSLLANIVAVDAKPCASELIDHHILDCTKGQIEQSENRFFVEGEPKAILVVEFAENDEESLSRKLQDLSKNLLDNKLAFSCPVVKGEDINKVWELRKAGLGLLSNIAGKAKPIAFIEDTAVDVKDLPTYIDAFNKILKAKNLYAVHYAHAGSGELHLRPVLDLQDPEDRKHFKDVANEVAELVKSYRGSLSGEHGDGRLRGSFIKKMYGEVVYHAFKSIKETWDPSKILNPNKIIEVPPIDSMLRVDNSSENKIETAFRYPKTGSLLAANTMCNGSGDCLKSRQIVGAMCPSYMATKMEKDSTRGRANILRNTLGAANPNLNSPEVKEALSLCISCKACKRECPSNVDMAKIKAEVSYQQQKEKFNLHAFLIARVATVNKSIILKGLYNLTRGLQKRLLKVHEERDLPKASFEKLVSKSIHSNCKTWLFVDEFTRMEQPELVTRALELLKHLGVEANILPLDNSARPAISVGQLDYAKNIIDNNLEKLSKLDIENIIGLEPSAVLGFKDEYPELCSEKWINVAKEIASKTFSFERFLSSLNIDKSVGLKCDSMVYIHVHCHQKALEKAKALEGFLKQVGIVNCSTLDSGCCGMAGFFGYKKENYTVSKAIAHNKLLPKLEEIALDAVVLGSGTSCRHQVADLSRHKLVHPINFLHALIS